MEGVSYEIETQTQFWGELDEILDPVGTPPSQIDIDSAIRSFIRFAAAFRKFLTGDEDVETLCSKLFRSEVWSRDADRVRHELIAISNGDEISLGGLYVIYWILFLDGQTEYDTLRKIRKARCIPQMVNVLWYRTKGDFELHRITMVLMFEVCRSERLSEEDLYCITEEFVEFLLLELEDDVDETVNSCICRLILAFNEQFMVTMNSETSIKAFPRETNSPPSPQSKPLANAVMQVLKQKGDVFKNFGQFIIFMLNRERETSLQLLILKLLYLIFTTPETYEYFYNNDLRVLVDVFIRELHDLPDDAESLRHTYLRVLHPLLSHTQLRHPPHYKPDQLNTLLTQLSGSKSMVTRHFRPIDQTTKRLVTRCIKVPWLCREDPFNMPDKPISPIHKKSSAEKLTFTEKLHEKVEERREERHDRLDDKFSRLGVNHMNVSQTSVHTVAAIRKPPPWVKTPTRRGKKKVSPVVVEETNGK